MKFMNLAASAMIAAVGFAGASNAAVLSVVGGISTPLPSSFDLVGTPVYDAQQGGVGDIGDPIATFGANKNATNGLSLSAPSNVTFTFLGAEAGFNNFAVTLGSTIFTVNDTPGVSSTSFFGSGFIPFSFNSVDNFLTPSSIANDGVRVRNVRLGFSDVFNGGESVIAYFDDTDISDIDYDDLVVRIDVSEIPLPAAAWMLLTALGGMGYLARRRTA
jgi:hypothetical protein